LLHFQSLCFFCVVVRTHLEGPDASSFFSSLSSSLDSSSLPIEHTSDSVSSSEKSLHSLSLSKTLYTRVLSPSSLSPLHFLTAVIPTEVSELIRAKKLFFIGLDAMCGARLGELQTSHVSISLQNTFKQHLRASHWTTISYI
jgi:hypothetical protein